MLTKGANALAEQTGRLGISAAKGAAKVGLSLAMGAVEGYKEADLRLKKMLDIGKDPALPEYSNKNVRKSLGSAVDAVDNFLHISSAAKKVDNVLHVSGGVEIAGRAATKAANVAGKVADKVAGAGVSVAASAAEAVEKGVESLPSSMHTLSAIFLRLPMGPMMVVTVLAALVVSVYWSRFFDRIVPWKSWPFRHLQFLKGHDAGFGTSYVFVTILALGMLFAISMISMRVQIPLLMAVGASIIGVVGSVTVDTVMATADPDGMQDEERGRIPQTRRRLFLHGSMALLSGMLALCIFIARAAATGAEM